jgi:hypothetical protein
MTKALLHESHAPHRATALHPHVVLRNAKELNGMAKSDPMRLAKDVT